ncbi:MAG: hypothetical protein ACON4B_04025 [Flavobacteriaceae bacterium]
MKQSFKYLSFVVGVILLVYNEVIDETNNILSITGLVFLIIGLYMISKGIGDKPEYDPYAIESEEEKK